MLHEETVERDMYELLKTLMRDPELSDFKLAGGTSLALFLGHRKSIDFDLFTKKSFEATLLERHLIKSYDFKGDYLEKNTLRGRIGNVKIDCITHNYPSIDESIATDEGIRLYGIRDIAAMKLSAIADNGTRLKDFIDIACLSIKMPLTDMLNAYQEKFVNSNPIRPLKGLTFFEEINFNEPIQMINGTYSWAQIEKRLHDMIKRKNHIFPSLPL